MRNYLLRQVLIAFLALVGLSVVIFGLGRLSGDPVEMLVSDYATQEDRDSIARKWGYDRPLVTQYFVFLGNLFTGDFGYSTKQSRPVSDIIPERFWPSVMLGGVAFLICGGIAVPVGMASALFRGSWLDRGGRLFAVLGQSAPSFWVGIVLMYVFGVYLGILPVAGKGGPSTYILPAFTMGWFVNAGLMRVTRSSMLEVLGSDYIRTARSKGLRERVVIGRHALRNALIPMVTFGGLVLAGLINGSVIVEEVFGWPGLGRLSVEAVRSRDLPVMQVVILLIAGLYIGANLAVDVLYAFIDPRIRY